MGVKNAYYPSQKNSKDPYHLFLNRAKFCTPKPPYRFKVFLDKSSSLIIILKCKWIFSRLVSLLTGVTMSLQIFWQLLVWCPCLGSSSTHYSFENTVVMASIQPFILVLTTHLWWGWQRCQLLGLLINQFWQWFQRRWQVMSFTNDQLFSAMHFVMTKNYFETRFVTLNTFQNQSNIDQIFLLLRESKTRIVPA